MESSNFSLESFAIDSTALMVEDCGIQRMKRGVIFPRDVADLTAATNAALTSAGARATQPSHNLVSSFARRCPDLATSLA